MGIQDSQAVHTACVLSNSHDVKFSRAKEAVANALLDLEIKKEEYAQVCSSKRKKTK